MKLAVTDQEEIKSLMNLCNEIESFYEELRVRNFEDINLKDDKEHFKILYPIWKNAEGNIEYFMEQVFREFNIVHYQRILWNCSTMLTNCADPNLDHLDFNPDIKKGLELLEESKNQNL